MKAEGIVKDALDDDWPLKAVYCYRLKPPMNLPLENELPIQTAFIFPPLCNFNRMAGPPYLRESELLGEAGRQCQWIGGRNWPWNSWMTRWGMLTIPPINSWFVPYFHRLWPLCCHATATSLGTSQQLRRNGYLSMEMAAPMSTDVAKNPPHNLDYYWFIFYCLLCTYPLLSGK